jgi:SprT-like family
MTKKSKTAKKMEGTKQNLAVTQIEYSKFQEAFSFLNGELFSAGLPPVLFTLQRKAHTRGYFGADRFTGRTEKSTVSEIALNPDHFTGRTDEQILSTVVHEMVHCWQKEFGTPSRRLYHNKEWAAKMKALGLQPSSTGAVGGKETGQSVTHYIVPGGAFAAAYDKLQVTGFKLHWQSAPIGNNSKTPTNKTKFTCAVCGANAWGKPDLLLICGECYAGDDARLPIMRSAGNGLDGTKQRVPS